MAKSWPDQIKHYKIGDELGSGSFSHVCKGVNTQNNTEYAIKVFPKSNLAEAGDQERFQREINTMAYLRQENLVALYDFMWDDANFYLVIDLCKGGELFDYIVDHDKLDEPTAALVFQQIVSAIAFCHSFGIAHRDLKPENVLIANFPRVKVADFGLCGFISDQQMMKTFCGSPCYCAPECLCRVQYDGRKSDIWSLGVILFAMVTGEHPWNISNTSIMLRQILKAAYTVPGFVSAQCKDLLSSILKVNPQDRISIEDIMKHPWLKLASTAAAKNKMQVAPLVAPVVQDITIADITKEAAETTQPVDRGIFSPFEAHAEEAAPAADAAAAALPKLASRSLSVENMVKGLGSGPPGSARKKIAASGNLAASRQKSATNLIAPKKADGKAKAPALSIAEDDDG
jgi:serine/threonine protein kinase